MRRSLLQGPDLVREVDKKSALVSDSSTQKGVIRHCAGHAFTEPQGPRVILMNIVNGLERRRTDPLHVPQMKELMSRRRREAHRIFFDPVGIGFNRSRIGVLHPARAQSVRKMV